MDARSQEFSLDVIRSKQYLNNVVKTCYKAPLHILAFAKPNSNLPTASCQNMLLTCKSIYFRSQVQYKHTVIIIITIIILMRLNVYISQLLILLDPHKYQFHKMATTHACV